MAYHPGEGWSVKVQTEEEPKSLIDTLTRFSCETFNLLAESPAGLFDNIERD